MAQVATASGGARQAYALVQAGDQQMGISADHVVQAIGWPAALTVLPRARGALAGVFEHGGQLVPLVSMAHWLHPETPEMRQAGPVLVLRSGGRMMGLAVDAVKGLFHADASGVHRVHHDDDPQELFHSVIRRASGAGLVSLLDPKRLAARVQAWCDEVPDPGVGERQGGGPSVLERAAAGRGRREVVVIVRSGQALLGFAAADVGEIVQTPPLQKAWGAGTPFAGIADWRGTPVPVVEPSALGLPAPALAPGGWLLIVRSRGRHAGLAVDQLLCVQALDPAQAQAREAVQAPDGPVFRGSLLHAGERVYLVDTAHFLESFALEGLDTAGGSAQLDTDTVATQAGSEMLLVFKSLQPWAGVMGAMQQITSFPAHVNWSHDRQRGVLGSFEWRGQALNLFDLRLLHGHAPSVIDATTRVIVIRLGRQLAGLVVEDVMALLPAHTCVQTCFVAAGGAAVHMVTLGKRGSQTSYQMMDFEALHCFPRDRS